MAFVSPNMGLTVWNSTDDLFDHAQLADNLARIDFHDHSPGRGLPIPTEGFADGSITSDKLALDATVPAVGSFSAYASSGLGTLTTADTLVFNTEDWDTDLWYDTGTGHFTPQVAGYYRVSASLGFSTDLAADGYAQLEIFKGGVVQRRGARYIQQATEAGAPDKRIAVTGIVDLNGSTDYVCIKVANSATLAGVTGASETYFQGELVGRS